MSHRPVVSSCLVHAVPGRAVCLYFRGTRQSCATIADGAHVQIGAAGWRSRARRCTGDIRLRSFLACLALNGGRR
jgi:hypothetical protein